MMPFPRWACFKLCLLLSVLLTTGTAIEPGQGETQKWAALFGVGLASRYVPVRVRAPTRERRTALCRRVCASNTACRRYGVSYVPYRATDEAECRLPLPPWRRQKGLACTSVRPETIVEDTAQCYRLCGVNCTRYSTRPITSALDERGDAMHALRVRCSVPADDDSVCTQRVDDATLYSIDARWLRNSLRMEKLRRRFEHHYDADTAVMSELHSAFDSALSMAAASSDKAVRRGGAPRPIMHPTTARAFANPVSPAHKITVITTALLFLGALSVATCYARGSCEGFLQRLRHTASPAASTSGAHFSTRNIADKNNSRSGTRTLVKI